MPYDTWRQLLEEFKAIFVIDYLTSQARHMWNFLPYGNKGISWGD